MQKISQKKGLALGAIAALLGSLFVSAPAQANSSQLVITPAAGPIGNFNGVLNEDFPVVGYNLPGSGLSNTDFKASTVLWEVTKVSGNMDVVAVASTTSMDLGATLTKPSPVTATNIKETVKTTVNGGGTTASVSGLISISAPVPSAGTATASANVLLIESSRSNALTVSGLINQDSSLAHLNLRAYTTSGVASASPAVTVRVKMWIENAQTTNGLPDTLEWSTSQTITLTNTNGLSAPATLTAPNVGDSVITASGTVNSVNFENISGVFFLELKANGSYIFDSADSDEAVTSSRSPELSGAALAARNGVVSFSFAVTNSTVVEAASFSIQVRYSTTSGSVNTAGLGTVANYPAIATAASALDLAVVASNDATQSAQTATVRANKTVTITVGARTGSNNVSVSGLAVEASLASGASLGAGGKSISVNGTATTSFAGKIALTTGTNGAASFTLGTSEFVGDESITVSVKVGNISRSLTVNVRAATYELSPDATVVSAKAGGTATLTYEVLDQWGVLAADATDLRVRFEKKPATGMSYTDTISTAVVTAGKVSFVYTSGSATRTGSPTVEATLQRLVAGTGGAYSTTGTTGGVKTVTVVVNDRADAFSVSPVASQSASVSYFPSTVSYKTVTTTVVNGGALVELSGPASLIFRENGKTTTASGKLAVRASSTGVVTVNVAALLAGTHTITIKVGDASTTSLLVVDAVSASAGVKIAFDKSSITAGETSVITGTVTDANGNPVDTTNEGANGKAALVVSWTGKGLPFNTGSSVETDEKGQFKVNVLALAADTGTGTLTATYRPAGGAVDTNNVTATQTVNIVAPAAPVAPEVNAVIGTFNGRWAVRVENAKGAVVAVKVGGNWFKYTSLNENYLFSRKSAVGRSVAVAVYVNGTLENVATITIK